MISHRPTFCELEEFLKNIKEKVKLSYKASSNLTLNYNNNCFRVQQYEEFLKIIVRPPMGMTLIKYGSRSVVGEFCLSDGDRVVLKYYYPRGIHKHLGYGIRGSRCMRSWIAAMAFDFIGLATPSAMMVAEWRAFGGIWLERSTLVTRLICGMTLMDWVVAHSDDGVRLKKVANQLQDHFSLMAHYRITHGDLKQSNILVDAEDCLSFSDLDAVTFHASYNDWKNERERDKKIFHDNWRNYPTATVAFANVFS